MNNLPDSLYDESGRPIKRKNIVKIPVMIKVLISLLFLVLIGVLIVFLYPDNIGLVDLDSGNGYFFLPFFIFLAIVFNIIRFKFQKSIFSGEIKDNNDESSEDESNNENEINPQEDLYEDNSVDEDLPDNEDLSDDDIDKIIDKYNK